MITLEEFYTNAWRKKAGLSELKQYKINYSIEELYKTQWSKEFEEFMRNRLVMGALRYGDIRTTTGYQYIPYLKKKLKNYIDTGNLEMLVDVANLALLEFVNGKHPKRNWSPLDDEKHCEKNKIA